MKASFTIRDNVRAPIQFRQRERGKKKGRKRKRKKERKKGREKKVRERNREKRKRVDFLMISGECKLINLL